MQKTQKFFSDTPYEVTNFKTSPMAPPFENFSLDALNSERKPFVKNSVDRASQKPVDRRKFRNLPIGSGRENSDRFHFWIELYNPVVGIRHRNSAKL